MIVDSKVIASVLNDNGICDFKIIDVKDNVIVEDWVRFHCMFGCPSYGNTGTCPPALPPVAECRAMVKSYKKAVIMRFDIPYVNENQYEEEIKAYKRTLSAKLTITTKMQRFW